jgi:hypothetical protein
VVSGLSKSTPENGVTSQVMKFKYQILTIRSLWTFICFVLWYRTFILQTKDKITDLTTKTQFGKMQNMQYVILEISKEKNLKAVGAIFKWIFYGSNVFGVSYREIQQNNLITPSSL